MIISKDFVVFHMLNTDHIKIGDLQDDCIDVDVPLSKKINRLNIDYSASNSNDLPPQSTFKEKYPYESDSNYYQTNEMLYTLHEERLEYYYF